MPPPRRGCRHCLFWYGGYMGQVTIGCAHCRYVSKVLDLSATYDEALIERQIEHSREAHAQICSRPIFGGS